MGQAGEEKSINVEWLWVGDVIFLVREGYTAQGW